MLPFLASVETYASNKVPSKTNILIMLIVIAGCFKYLLKLNKSKFKRFTSQFKL